MLANDLQHRCVGKSLFVITEQGDVDAGENCGLAGSALRTTFNAQARISRHDNAVMYCSSLVRPEILRAVLRQLDRRKDSVGRERRCQGRR